MIKKYKITGLDCPNCAKTLESKLSKLKSIKSANINFIKSELSIDSDSPDLAISEAIKLTKQIEPNAKIIVKKTASKKSNAWISTTLLAVGIILAVLVFTLKMPVWLYWTLFVSSAILMGYKTYYKAICLLFKGVINENFLVTISVVGATLVGEQFDGLMVIALYTIGKILEGLALNKSKKSIAKLTSIKPEYATLVLTDGTEKTVLPEELNIGDIIKIKAGEKIAVDGIVQSGKVSLNTQSLTGESLPQVVCAGNKVLSGCIVLDGVITIKATNLYADSAVSKILDLVENASDKKAKTETVISSIAKWYSLAVMGLSIVVWAIVWAVTKNIDVAIYRGLTFLVVSCPCAFAISVPLAYFSGLGNASKNGILIKGSNYLDILSKLDTIAFDKTGTLTTGQFSITKIEVFDKSLTQQDVLYFASLGEQNSTHPLAKAILQSNKKPLQKVDNISEIAGEGIYYTLGKDNYFVGRKDNSSKFTCVQVYKNDVLLGKIEFEDTIKPQSKQVIQSLKNYGVKTAMLSGDSEFVVKQIAQQLQVDAFAYKQLPENKFNWIESQKRLGKKIGYVGDGINDAPSLTLSDVGISMGLNGSPASIEASDIVIANDNPKKIVDAIQISKYTRKIVWQNIILSAVIKVTFLTLCGLGITGMLSAVIADVGVTVCAILNSLRTLKYTPKNNSHLAK